MVQAAPVSYPYRHTLSLHDALPFGREASARSTLTTSSAPRRASSKAKKPSEDAASRQRLPASEAGIGSLATTLRWSNRPGVTLPPGRSNVWYQASPSTCLRSNAGSRRAGAAVDTRPEIGRDHV